MPPVGVPVLAGAEVLGADGAVVLEGDPFPGVTLLMPNQLSTSFACSGTVCPTPWAKIAWTLGPNEALEYPGRGLLVRLEVGVWLTPKTFVHCLMSSQKF